VLLRVVARFSAHADPNTLSTVQFCATTTLIRDLIQSRYAIADNINTAFSALAAKCRRESVSTV
jgi:hypothetical protein